MNKLRIASFNCKGFKNRNYDYLVDIFKKCDILFLQETWLYSFQENSIVDTLIDSCCYHVSGMSPSDIGRQGRPFGGCSIVYRKSLPMQVTPVVSSLNTICAVKLIIDKSKFLMLSVYMPVNDGSNANITEFEDVMNEITSILRSHDDFAILIGGDFNLDLKRDCTSSIYNVFNDFISVENLFCHDEVLDIDSLYYTFESSTGSRSAIDHFIFSEMFLDNVVDFKVLLDGNNLSDHKPIYLEYVLDDPINVMEKDDIVFDEFSYDWRNATNEHLETYRYYLDEQLSLFFIPDEVKNCSEPFCKSHTGAMSEYMEEVVNIINTSTELAIPKIKSKNGRCMPGWNKYVRFFKDRSIFWNKIWLESGSPSTGELMNLRKYSRSKYHEAIRYVKRNRDKIIREKVASTLKFKTKNIFWKQINKLKSKNKLGTNIMDGQIRQF